MHAPSTPESRRAPAAHGNTRIPRRKPTERYERYADDLLCMQVPEHFVRPWIDYMQYRRLRQPALFDGLAYYTAGLTPTRAIDYHGSHIPPFLAPPFNEHGWLGPDARALLVALHSRGIRGDWRRSIQHWLSIGGNPYNTTQYIQAGVNADGATVFETRRAASPEAEGEVDAALQLIIALTRPTTAG